MLDYALHPNTTAMLQAWRRMSDTRRLLGDGPNADDFPGLLGRLFVLAPDGGGAAPFRISGERVPELLGRDIVDLDFLDLWRGADRSVAAGALRAVLADASPALIKAVGETGHGGEAALEIALAPLDGLKTGRARVLGLYQPLTPEARLRGQPITRHAVSAVVMPQRRPERPRLRLVASND